jgi:GNAT superfamily N-acetyltransferase
MRIYIAKTSTEIQKTFPVMVQLRPTLSKGRYNDQIRRQEKEGYKLVILEDEGRALAVAGIRLMESLHAGRFLYIDDLVTDSKNRSKGHGDRLFDWILEYAKKEKCKNIQLDSGVHRFDAHRFYLRKRMMITAHHFGISLSE